MGWPSARLFGWSACDWSSPVNRKSISSDTKKKGLLSYCKRKSEKACALIGCVIRRALPPSRNWNFLPLNLQGDQLKKGQTLGYVEQLGTYVPVEVRERIGCAGFTWYKRHIIEKIHNLFGYLQVGHVTNCAHDLLSLWLLVVASSSCAFTCKCNELTSATVL